MTFAQMLLAPIVAIMAADMATTAKGLGLGHEEKNFLAAPIMDRFGMLRGMLIYEGVLLLILGTVVVLFPAQWALPLAVAAELLITVVRNVRILKRSKRVISS